MTSGIDRSNFFFSPQGFGGAPSWEQVQQVGAGIVGQTGEAIATLHETVGQAQNSLEATMRRAENLSGGMADVLQHAVATAVQNWLSAHRFWGWLIQHPLVSVLLILVLLTLLRGLLGAIAQFVEQAWVAVLRSPLELGKWLLGVGTKSFQLAITPGTAKREVDSKQQRLTEILNRLETLKQEQDALLQEVKTLLGSEKAQS